MPIPMGKDHGLNVELRFVWPSEVTHFGYWLSHSWPLSFRMLGGPRGWRFFGIEYDVVRRPTA